jgi:dihydroorotate dehydrogenase (NAD+) catalytic subunit
LEELDTYLQRKGMTAAELVGMAADRRKTFADMPLRKNNWKKYVADYEEGIGG